MAMARDDLKAYLADGTKWLDYFTPGKPRLIIAYSLIERAGSTLETPGLLGTYAYEMTDLLAYGLKQLRSGGIMVQETLPSDRSFRLYHIHDGKQQYVTDVDILS